MDLKNEDVKIESFEYLSNKFVSIVGGVRANF